MKRTCHACSAQAEIVWPNMPQGWAVRGDFWFVACPNHTDTMPHG